MKRILQIALAAGLGSAFAVPALAGNLTQPKPEPQVAPAPAPVVTAPAPADWTGGYAGVGLGYSKAKTSPDVGSGSSGIGSLYGGYNKQFGNFVVGGEVGLNKAHSNYGTGTLKTSYDAKLRGGYATGKTLIYGALGAAHADSVHGVGKMVGLGVDYKLTDKVVVGGEADYTAYKNGVASGTDLKNTTVQARVSFLF